MTPEFKALLDSYPDANPDDLKLIFIRNSAKKAFVEGKISEASNSLMSEIALIGTIGEMGNDDEIREHLKNLETCRKYLSCHIQGLNKAWEEKLVPEFNEKAKRNEVIDKVRKKTKDKGVLDLVQALLNANSASKTNTNSTPNPTSIKKEMCDKCKTEVFSLKYHKC